MAGDGVEPRPSSYRWVVISAFNTTHATAVVGATVLGILLPSMTEELGLSPSQQGWLGASALMGGLIFSVPFGWWLSRYSPKRMTTITLGAGAIFVFLQGWAPVFAVLFVGRLLYGLTSVAREPARMLLVHQWLPQREIALSNGILNAIFGLSLTGAFIAAPVLLKVFDDDWRNTLYVFGFFSVSLTVVWILLGREHPTRGYRDRVESQEGSPIRSIFRYREPWLLGIGIVGYSIAQMAQFTFWPTFMQESFGVSLVTSGFMLGVLGVVVATGGLVVLPITAKAGGHKLPLVVSGVSMAATFVAVLLTDSIPVLVAIFIVNGLSRGAFWLAFTTVPFELPGARPREMAVIQAVMFTMFWAGGVLGPILVGLVQEATGDLRLALMISSLAPIAITVMALMLPARGAAAVQAPPLDGETGGNRSVGS